MPTGAERSVPISPTAMIAMQVNLYAGIGYQLPPLDRKREKEREGRKLNIVIKHINKDKRRLQNVQVLIA